MQPVPSPASFAQQSTQHQTPKPVQQPATTAGIDAARERLSGIERLTTLEQVEAFDAVHRLLQDSLAAVEQELRPDASQNRHGRR